MEASEDVDDSGEQPMFPNTIHLSQPEIDILIYTCYIGSCKGRFKTLKDLEDHLFHCISENLGVYVTKLRASYVRYISCVHVRFDYTDSPIKVCAPHFPSRES